MADGIVCLSVDFTAAPGTQTTATLERGLSATGPWTFIRTVDLLNQLGQDCDTAAPLDTQVWYRWTGDPGGTTIVQGPFIEPSDGTVLLKDPLRPWANISLAFCATPQGVAKALCNPNSPELIWAGFGETVFRADANLFDVYNARVPSDIFGYRKRLDGELRLHSKTLNGRVLIETLFAGGGPLQIQLPAIYGFPDAFVQPGDLTEGYIASDQRIPHRSWQAPFTVVDAPMGPVQGTENANWCAVQETFGTFAALTASGFTWAQVASGQAVDSGSTEFDGFGEGQFGDGPYGDGG